MEQQGFGIMVDDGRRRGLEFDLNNTAKVSSMKVLRLMCNACGLTTASVTSNVPVSLWMNADSPKQPVLHRTVTSQRIKMR